MTGARWLFALLLWAALDLSGPVLFVSAEVFEESEEAAHRTQARRLGRRLAALASRGRWQVPRPATLPSPVAAAASRRRGPETGRGEVLKLPPAGPGPASAPDDH